MKSNLKIKYELSNFEKSSDSSSRPPSYFDQRKEEKPNRQIPPYLSNRIKSSEKKQREKENKIKEHKNHKQDKKEKKRLKKLQKEIEKEEADLKICRQMELLNAFNAAMFLNDENSCDGQNIPISMICNMSQDSFFPFGKDQLGNWIGKPDDIEGHFAAFARSGGGKTQHFVRNALKFWKGPIFTIDFKGDVNPHARKRGSKIIYFMPNHKNQYYIDPFYFLKMDGENNLILNCRALAFAIIPMSSNESEPFWRNSARDILAGALLYFYRLGVSFIDAIIAIKRIKILKLLKKIASDEVVHICINFDMEKILKTLENVNAVLQNYIIPFAADPIIQEAFSSDDDNPKELIKWESLENQDIIIRMDLSKIDQWSGVIRLMIVQLIKTLQRRPEKYETAGKNLKPTLLLLDEFSQYGRISEIVNALKTLRSKGVTFALLCQSLVDLDETYGETTRRCIMDNCPYKAVLSADDLDTQKYWSELVGIVKTRIDGFSSSFDELGIPSGYNFSVSSKMEPIIYPHEFASLHDVILIHPGKERFCRLEKDLSFQTKTDEKSVEIIGKKEVIEIKTLETRILESKKAVKAAEQKRKEKKRKCSEDIEDVHGQIKLNI